LGRFIYTYRPLSGRTAGSLPDGARLPANVDSREALSEHIASFIFLFVRNCLTSALKPLFNVNQFGPAGYRLVLDPNPFDVPEQDSDQRFGLDFWPLRCDK
jgi:hypothetical protein